MNKPGASPSSVTEPLTPQPTIPIPRGPVPQALEIGVDGTCWASTRGYGRFLRELLPELLRLDSDHRYTLILDRWTAEAAELPAVRTIVVDTSAGQALAASARGNRSLFDLWRMGRATGRTGAAGRGKTTDPGPSEL